MLDRDGIRTRVQNWRSCSKRSTDAVAIAGCSSNMTTGSRWIISTVTTEIRAMRICKRYMDTVTMRKRGSMETIFRQVCVISIRILRSGVRRKFHAPFWISGRRSDPSIDCNRVVRRGVAGKVLGGLSNSLASYPTSCVGSGRGRWKSTLMGNSLAAYSTLMRSSEGGREKSTH